LSLQEIEYGIITLIISRTTADEVVCSLKWLVANFTTEIHFPRISEIGLLDISSAVSPRHT
jgi:hypothetical protein